MDTVRVDIRYRPLRIAWAISADDIDAFRQAVRTSYALWGGRFNPIIVVDHEEEAVRLVDLFRVDMILPIGESETVKAFSKRFPHLSTPLFPSQLFIGDGNQRNYAQVLDMHNALVHFRDKPEWNALKDKGVCVHNWQACDPLADIFLVQFGAYPSIDNIGIDYRGMLMEAVEATEYNIDPIEPITVETLARPSIAYLSRHGLNRHYSTQWGWDCPGFFVGDAKNVDDLVCHWNLRASDIPLWFIDPKHLPRYQNIIPDWERSTRERVAHRQECDRKVGVWSRREDIEEAAKPFGDLKLTRCRVSSHTWNGRNVCPPMMHFDQVSTLGVIGREGGKPKVSFPLSDKPFCGDSWFHTQHLVASISFLGGLYRDEHYTLNPPFIPELNEFLARTMHFEYNKLRIESASIGLVIDAADKDAFLYALPVADLVEKIFGMADFRAKLSSAGLIARQLIAQLGGLQGARAFKIPGVRRLLKTHGPTSTFTKNGALHLIGGKDPDNPKANFKDHQNLHIGPRAIGTQLEPLTVFSRLVERGLFRIGADLTCPNCRMVSWIALDILKQRVVCDLCGHSYDATRQLVDGDWHYRRSGVLGAEKNAQGAIPVVLTLQQLDTNLGQGFSNSMYSSSLDLEPVNDAEGPCEVDFAWVISRGYPRKTVIILSECKDQGGKGQGCRSQGTIDAKDIKNLRRVADALPRKRFKTFLLLAKLCPFTEEEIALAKTLNDKGRQRVILLTARELEPYHIFERTKLEFKIEGYGSSPEELAQATVEIYFKDPPADLGES